MAASRGAVVAAQELSADEQAQLDAMRNDEAAPIEAAPEPEAEEPAAPAQEAEEPTEGAAAERRMVPVSALQEERERRKSSDAQLQEERKARALLEERTNIILQQFNQQRAQPQAQQVAQPAAIPDPNVDPLGHILGTLQAQGQQLQQLSVTAQQRSQIDQNAAAIQGLQQHAMAAEREFAAVTPDYHQAIQHLAQFRQQQLAELGYSPVERQNMIGTEALGIAARAQQMGKNPAEIMYALAKQSGYQGAASATTPDPAQRLAQVAAGQQQARGLGNARGGSPTQLTVQRLLEMSPAEFDKAMKTSEGKALMGA